MRKLTPLLLLGVFGIVSLVRADTLAGNLGPGNSFQSGTGNSWATGGPGDPNNPGNSSNAVGFIVPLGQNYILDQILIADNWYQGPSSLDVALYAGSDPNSATLVESFSIPAGTSAQFDSVLFTLDSVLHPTLIGGDSYFVEETIGDCAGSVSCDTTWGWQVNNIGQTGYSSSFAGGSWFAESGDTPAFEVTGTPAVPEPAYFSILAAAMGFLVIARRRKSVQA